MTGLRGADAYNLGFTATGLGAAHLHAIASVYWRLRDWDAAKLEAIAGNVFQQVKASSIVRLEREFRLRLQTLTEAQIQLLVESPKKHFRALIYLHRYNKDTVNKLLNGYLREFRHKLTHRREDLEQGIASGTASTVDRKALTKVMEAIKDVEEYERNILLPLAQQRLEIDLDDGVKQNYPKFGAALAKIVGL